MSSRKRRLSTDMIEWGERNCGIKLMGWQKRFVRGSYETDESLVPKDAPPYINGRIRDRGLLSVGRQNGKTTLAAFLVVCHLFHPRLTRPAQRIICIAGASKGQAILVFEAAKQMIEDNPSLKAMLDPATSQNKLRNVGNHGYLELMAANMGTLQGRAPTLWIMDEYAQALDSKAYDTLSVSQGAIEEGMGLVTSTNTLAPGNPFRVLCDEIVSSQKNGKWKHWWYQMHSADPELNPFTWKAVKQANPGLGITVKREQIAKQMDEARTSEKKKAWFMTFVLNRAYSEGISLVDELQWMQLGDSRLKMSDFAGEDCIVGLDLSSHKSLTSIGFWFPRRKVMLTRNVLPGEKIQDYADRHHAPYRDWLKMGLLDETRGSAIALDEIIAIIVAVARVVNVVEVRADDHRIELFKQMAEEAGVAFQTRRIGMNYSSLGPLVMEFAASVSQGDLAHDANPCTAMCVRNTIGKPGHGNLTDWVLPIAMTDGQPIDAFVAMALAHGTVVDKKKAKRRVAFHSAADDEDLMAELEESDDGYLTLDQIEAEMEANGEL